MSPALQTSKYDVLVGISSGIDSTYALHWFLSQNKNPLALLLSTGYNAGAIDKAKHICKKLGAALKIRDISEEFNQLVIEKTKSLYGQGLTPNPCVICNHEIKFRFLFETAMEENIPFIATGHYASIAKDSRGRLRLAQAKDAKKDQSYFLYKLLNQGLSKILFPLQYKGKTEIEREISDIFPDFFSKESQDLCFIKKNYRAELFRGKTQPGYIYNEKKELLGMHKGLRNYTIGQREGLGIEKPGPWYVYDIDAENNCLFVGDKAAAEKKEVFFLLEAPKKPPELKSNIVLSAKIRYNQEKLPVSKIEYLEDNKLRVVFKNKAFAPAPGQAIVLYEGDFIFAGGTILK